MLKTLSSDFVHLFKFVKKPINTIEKKVIRKILLAFSFNIVDVIAFIHYFKEKSGKEIQPNLKRI